MKNTIMICMMVFSFGIKAEDYKNPYVNKNLDSHLKEFLSFEMVADFHRGIAKYNQERKELPEAKFVENHYLLTDGKNKLEFNIQLALKGNFFYNDKLSNINDLKILSSPKSVLYSLFISEAYAAAPLSSTVLLAALTQLIPKISKANSKELLNEKIELIYNECIDMDHADSEYINRNTSSADVTNMQMILEKMELNRNKENDIVEKMIEDNKLANPNCSGIKEDKGWLANAKENFNLYGKSEYAAPLSDVELCANLAKLKVCLISNNTSLNKVADNVARATLKYSKDDIKQHASEDVISAAAK